MYSFKPTKAYYNMSHTATFCYVNSSVKMKNAPLLAYYQSYSFNLTSITNYQWRKSFTSAKQSCVIFLKSQRQWL